MRSVVQRVRSASVSIHTEDGGNHLTKIGAGFLILNGVRNDDNDADAAYLAEKIANLRAFPVTILLDSRKQF